MIEYSDILSKFGDEFDDSTETDIYWDKQKKVWIITKKIAVADVQAGLMGAIHTFQTNCSELSNHDLQLLSRVLGIPEDVVPLKSVCTMTPDAIQKLRDAALRIGTERLRTVLAHWKAHDLLLESYVGGGAWGHVFLYTQQDKKPSVVKILVPPYDDEWQKRFHREIAILNDLPNGIQVPHLLDDPVEIDGVLSYRMEYIDGISLEQVERPVECINAVRWIISLLRVLQEVYSHRKMVHRDLHLGNVLLLRYVQDEVAVLDFGLARDEAGIDYLKTFLPVGAMSHRAPEKWRNPSGVDIRSDLLSVGVMFYRLLTNQYPFWSETYYELEQRILQGDHPRACDINRSIPVVISHFIDTLLSPEPGMRPDSPEEALSLLTKIQDYRETRLRQLDTSHCPRCGSPDAQIHSNDNYIFVDFTCAACKKCGYAGSTKIILVP